MFNQNFVYPFYDVGIVPEELYRNNTTPALFTPSVGFDNGNLFSNLYKPYKDYKPVNVSSNNEREALMRELGRISFAAHELNLYLDIHPEDTGMITLFNDYREQANKLMREYDQKFGPLMINSNSLNQNPFMWEKDVFPWEVKPNV